MSQRIDALVHGDLSAEEAAEVIGCPLDALVQHGNGYAVVVPFEAPKPRRKSPKPKSLIPDPEDLGHESEVE